MQFKTSSAVIASVLSLASAKPQLLPVSVPALPLSVPLGVNAPATSVINSIAGTTGLPILSNISPVPSVSVPTGLPTVPISGLTTNPTTLANDVSEGIQILQLVLSILEQLSSTGLVPIPGASSLGLGVEGTLIVALLALAKGMIPTS